MYKILNNQNENKPYLFLYTDGGPDHRVTYVRVQMALIALYLKLDLDMLVAVRTPPGHSWKNPVERIMSILNLGLQSIGLMRNEMSEELEKIMKKCNSMDDIREQSKNKRNLKEELIGSLQPTIDLMEGIFERLLLKGEVFKTFKAASEENISELWELLLEIDETLEPDDKTKKSIKDKVSVFIIIYNNYFII